MFNVRDINRIPAAIAAIEAAESAAVESVAEDAVEQIDKGFDNGQDALGTAWEPLSPETIRRKGNSDILEDTGEFRESFDYSVDEETGKAYVGTGSELAPYHEFGVPERGLPKRPVLGPAGIWVEKNYPKTMRETMRRHLAAVDI